MTSVSESPLDAPRTSWLSRLTLTHRICILLLIALIPMLVSQLYRGLELRRARTAEAQTNAVRQAKLAASEIAAILNGVRDVLLAVARDQAVDGGSVAGCDAYLSSLQPAFPHLTTIALLDLEGRYVCGGAARPSSFNATQPAFREALRTRALTVGEYSPGRLSGEAVWPILLPLADAGGEVRAILTAGLRLSWLGRRIAERALDPGGSLVVADRSGTVLAREPDPGRFVGTQVAPSFRPWLTASGPGAEAVTSLDGARRISGYLPVGYNGNPFYVSAGVAAENVYAIIDTAFWRGAALTVAALALAFAVAWVAGHVLIEKPLNRLLATAQAWRGGDYGVRSGITPAAGEVALLGGTLDRMAGEIERRARETEGTLAALREREAELARVQRIGEVAGVDVDLRAGFRNHRSPEYLRLHGLDESSRYEPHADWVARIHPDDRKATEQKFVDAVKNGDVEYEAEYRIVRPRDKELRWIYARAEIERDPSGKPIRLVGAHIDITHRKAIEAEREQLVDNLQNERRRQQLLINELNHRVKNTLATVQSLADQTLRGATDMTQARQRLEARLIALSGAHNVLTRESWEGANFDRIVAQSLSPFIADGQDRIVKAGPTVRLSPQASLALAMALHELSTNAVKYGALSTDAGRIELTWSVDQREGADRLLIRWEERGGPQVAPPTRRGFGTKLIERGLARDLGGETKIDYPKSGLVCTIAAPLTHEPAEAIL